MTSINKQNFLAELGKLLTFMYEEDRQRAIGMYSRMFEEAGDDMALIQMFVSPTKQAVVVARAYNSNLGKLSVYSETKAVPEDNDENGVPDYVQAIEAVREQAWAALGLPAAEEKAEEEAGEEAESEAAEEEAEEEAESEAAETEEEQSEEAESEAAVTEAETEEEPSGEAEAEPCGNEPEEEAAAVPAQEPQEAPAVSAAPAEASVGDRGIEYFTLPEEGAEEHEAEEGERMLSENGFNVNSEPAKKPRRKAKVFALIVYILFAIPLTLAAIAVLLVPAVLFLALSVAAIICGVVLVSTAFNGFAVFADIMVVLGVSLVLFALGLLFLWTSIWFIGGAIVGLVHGVAALCDKWCYKEVQEG